MRLVQRVAGRISPRQAVVAAAEHWRDLRSDARFAVRMLARAPGFTLAAVLCLAIGTGLTAAMYAQIQSTVLADLPGAVREPDTLVRIQ